MVPAHVGLAVYRNGRWSVAIENEVLGCMETYSQAALGSHEACGVLLGYEWDDAAQIVKITPPQPSDIRSRFGYTRHTDGHSTIALEHWTRSGPNCAIRVAKKRAVIWPSSRLI